MSFLLILLLLSTLASAQKAKPGPLHLILLDSGRVAYYFGASVPAGKSGFRHLKEISSLKGVIDSFRMSPARNRKVLVKPTEELITQLQKDSPVNYQPFTYLDSLLKAAQLPYLDAPINRDEARILGLRYPQFLPDSTRTVIEPTAITRQGRIADQTRELIFEFDKASNLFYYLATAKDTTARKNIEVKENVLAPLIEQTLLAAQKEGKKLEVVIITEVENTVESIHEIIKALRRNKIYQYKLSLALY